MVRHVAQGVGRLVGQPHAAPVGAVGGHVTQRIGIGRADLGQQHRRRRAARGAAVGPALHLGRRELLGRAVGPGDGADALSRSRR